MQNPQTASLRVVARLLFAWLSTIFLLPVDACSQQPSKDSVYTLTDSTVFGKTYNTTNTTDTDDVVRTFEEFNLPPEMLAHFGQITPDDAVTLHDEFQVTQNDENGIPILITVKLRFKDDRLTGYIIEAPIDKTSDASPSSFTVNIPIEWICTPATAEHQQHYVGSLAAIKIAEAQYKCTGWHIKLPEPPVKEDPKKKSKKDKNANKNKKITGKPKE